MGLLKKQTLQDIGRGIEYTGYGLLVIASIVGIAAPIIAIIASASQESKQSSSRGRRGHSGGGTNILFIGNNWGNSSPVNPSSNEPIEHYFYWSIIEHYFYWSIGLSVVGIILALALEVAWVALMVAGLWVTGAALLLLGQQVTAYANLQSDDVIVPSESFEQSQMNMPVPSAPVMPLPEVQSQMNMPVPSAPVMQQEAQLQEQIQEPGSGPSNSKWSWSSLWASKAPSAPAEPGAPVPNYTPNMGLI